MKANYFKVGVFLVLAMALIVAAVVILGAGTFAPKGEFFETYFDRSVAGLNKGAPVELQGVEVGRIESVRTSPACTEIDSASRTNSIGISCSPRTRRSSSPNRLRVDLVPARRRGGDARTSTKRVARRATRRSITLKSAVTTAAAGDSRRRGLGIRRTGRSKPAQLPARRSPSRSTTRVSTLVRMLRPQAADHKLGTALQ